MKSARAYNPRSKLEGVLISPMIEGGVECILGAKTDPVFGPVVLFGLGGVFTEVLKDVAFRHAPIGPETPFAKTGGLADVAGALPPCA